MGRGEKEKENKYATVIKQKQVSGATLIPPLDKKSVESLIENKMDGGIGVDDDEEEEEEEELLEICVESLVCVPLLL